MRNRTFREAQLTWLPFRWGAAAVVLAGAIILCSGARGEDDPDYARLLGENEADRSRIEEVETAIAQDPELEASLLAYQDSVTANSELAAQEEALDAALESDSVLVERLAGFEEAAARDPEASQQLASFDSLLAADSELAARYAEIEREAAADPEILDTQGSAIAYLETHPDEGSAFFALEAGPTYVGADPVLVAYGHYLRGHPPLYRAWWRLHDHLRPRAAVARALHAHWHWLQPRRELWHAWWAFRLRAAQDARIHQRIWQRRLFLGGHPVLARQIWHHRLLVASHPILRSHVRFLNRHPAIARGMLAHRRWVHRHDPGPARPQRVRPKPPRNPRR